MDNREDTNLKVFNTAKKYAEDILFPKMEQFQTYQKQAAFGAEDLNEASLLTEELRDIQRYNALKAMNEVLADLLTNITSTVKLKGNKEEIAQLDKLIKFVKDLRDTFYEHRERFFSTEYRGNEMIEKLNRKEFDKMKEKITICYVNCEILMTRNKLLFADANDEFLSDKEILENIKREYVEG